MEPSTVRGCSSGLTGRRSATDRQGGNSTDAAPSAPCEAVPWTLAAAPSGRDLRVRGVGGENGHAQRLRELGLYEGQTVQVLLVGNPLICRVGDCRFGLCHRLARHITVELFDATVSKRSA